MKAENVQFNRILLFILVALYLVTMGAFLYVNWAIEPDLRHWWMMALNFLILSIPLGLLYGGIYVLIRGWREHARLGRVSQRMGKIIRWAPRLAAIAIIFFVSLFSFDVFGSGASLLEELGGFLMHNIPSIGMVILLFFAWKRPKVGFIAFLVVGVFFIVFFVRGIYSLPNLLLFVFPIWLVAGLFLVDWKWNEETKDAPA